MRVYKQAARLFSGTLLSLPRKHYVPSPHAMSHSTGIQGVREISRHGLSRIASESLKETFIAAVQDPAVRIIAVTIENDELVVQRIVPGVGTFKDGASTSGSTR